MYFIMQNSRSLKEAFDICQPWRFLNVQIAFE